jgi:hypothetical protein
MGKAALRQWASRLGVPSAFRELVKAPYDLGLVLLGDDYLDACALDAGVQVGGPTLLFCGSHAQRGLPGLDGLRAVPLTNVEARRFSCGLVALKGELVARLLDARASDHGFLATLLAAPDVLEAVETVETPVTRAPNRGGRSGRRRGCVATGGWLQGLAGLRSRPVRRRRLAS